MLKITPIENLDQFQTWMMYAKFGDTIAYHVGESLWNCRFNRNILEEAEKGNLLLFQKKLPPSEFVTLQQFEYRAVRSNREFGLKISVWANTTPGYSAEVLKQVF